MSDTESREPVSHEGVEPEAAERYDGHEACAYDDCNNPADYRVQIGYRRGQRALMLCCSRCSTRHRIYVEENELLKAPVTIREKMLSPNDLNLTEAMGEMEIDCPGCERTYLLDTVAVKQVCECGRVLGPVKVRMVIDRDDVEDGGGG